MKTSFTDARTYMDAADRAHILRTDDSRSRKAFTFLIATAIYVGRLLKRKRGNSNG